MNKTLKEKALRYYLLLGGLFITALVTCNLIANKFISVDFNSIGIDKIFIISAGVLPYPITFLITDLLSEFYGRKRTNHIVLVGFIVSLFALFILKLGNVFPAIEGSPVNNEIYATMFQNSYRVVFASMAAYLVAQLIDIRVYHFWKKKTKGKHLWLRNNGSTIISQLVDTSLVVMVLFYNTSNHENMSSMILDGWLFKVICALIDTPVLYFLVFLGRRRFKLNSQQNINLI